MSELMSIGEFAAATWLSAKALRLYDEKGLLSPAVVDPDSGYRRYHPEQIRTARLVTMLRRIDMPLDLVAEVLANDPDDRAELIRGYREDDARRAAQRQSLAQYLETAVAGGDLDGEGQPGISAFEAGMRTVDEHAILTSTRHTSAKDLPEVIRDMATHLSGLARERGGVAGPLVVVYHGQIGWESDGPIEVCVPIADPARAHRVEPAHREVFTRVGPGDVQFPRIVAAYEAVRLHAGRLGLRSAGPPREIYHFDDPNGVPRCEVALPVREPPVEETPGTDS